MSSLELNEEEMQWAEHILKAVDLIPNVSDSYKEAIMEAIECIAYSAYMRGGEDK